MNVYHAAAWAGRIAALEDLRAEEEAREEQENVLRAEVLLYVEEWELWLRNNLPALFKESARQNIVARAKTGLATNKFSCKLHSLEISSKLGLIPPAFYSHVIAEAARRIEGIVVTRGRWADEDSFDIEPSEI